MRLLLDFSYPSCFRPCVDRLAHTMCVTAQLPLDMGGGNGKVIYIGQLAAASSPAPSGLIYRAPRHFGAIQLSRSQSCSPTCVRHCASLTDTEGTFRPQVSHLAQSGRPSVTARPAPRLRSVRRCSINSDPHSHTISSLSPTCFLSASSRSQRDLVSESRQSRHGQSAERDQRRS